MYKPKETRTDENDLTPEELEAAIALYKAQKAEQTVSEESADGEETVNTEGQAAEASKEEKSPIEQVKEHIDRRDSEGKEMTPEEIIAEQKADLDKLLAELDKLQAANDMNADKGEKEAIEKEDVDSSEETNQDSEGEKEEKGVNMDSIDKIIQDRLDICRMADKLHLDGVEKLSVRDGRKKIIQTVNPKMNLDGKSDSYLNAAYDIAKQTFQERKSTNDQRKQMVSNQVRQDAREESNSNSARKDMIARMKGEKK